MVTAKASRSWEEWNTRGLGFVITTAVGMCHRHSGHPSVKSRNRPGKDTVSGNSSN